ncbi:MAG: bifunctional indole-3-glycerol-phosphate synthase TrpC/phosphoribosylanthranilate isomerase TrpF [Gammaproteobacteria bacterium]
MALAEILAAKRRRLERALPGESPHCTGRRGPKLAEALSRPWPGFILECKAASPSVGVLIADYDPAQLAGAYDGIADAVSVLTEPEFFGGDLTHLARVREHIDVPILRKDFILGPDEVREARAYGADAVLLMLSVLNDDTWQQCFEAAAGLGMDVLTEVHDEQELERALVLEAPIVGINNRNLKTLAVDLAVTERLAPRIPPGHRVVCESGIGTRADILRLAPLVDGFLIGTRLSRYGRPGHAARELASGRVKVCGLTRPDDARAAWRAGAVMGGLNFAPDSPRRIDEATARRVQAAAPLDWVGVFRNQPVAEVAALARTLTLGIVQLHGIEDSAYGSELRAVLPVDCEIWKAVPGRAPLPDPKSFGADRLLLDSGRGGRLGGSGIAFDAAALSGADLSNVILAGGITPDNMGAAAGLGPWMLDVNSGVESAPGRKDEKRLRELFTCLRALPGRRSPA